MLLKPSFYDNFYCIGGECSYTCCMDWEIPLDKEETDRHIFADGKRNEAPLIIKPDGSSRLRFREDGHCSFLREDGLCRLVLEHGEEFISHTCHVFPRFDNTFNGTKEMYLSNGCPAVLDFFLDMPSPMTFIGEDFDCDPGKAIDEVMMTLRDRCIDLLQLNEIPLYARLFMLQRFSGEYEKTRDAEAVSDKMINAKEITGIYGSLMTVEVPAEKTMNILYQVIRDIGFYKKNLGAYKLYIKRAENTLDKLVSPDDDIKNAWTEFISEMKSYEVFFEHLCVNYIFTHTDLITQSGRFDTTVRTLLLEYILIRGVLFLLYLDNEKSISDTEVKNTSAFYARMYEHGLAGAEGFVAANLDNPWFSEAGFLTMLK